MIHEMTVASAATICILASLLCQDSNTDATDFSFKVTPGFFVSNSTRSKNGTPLINQHDVVAFAPTTRGRVLFTDTGAFFGAIGKDTSSDDGDVKNTGEASLQQYSEQEPNHVVVMKSGFSAEHGEVSRQPELRAKLPGKVNFMVGPEPQWQVGLETWGELFYPAVWAGIDVVFVGHLDHLEYRVEIGPGADARLVKISTGANHLELLEDGGLRADLSGSSLWIGKPHAFQIIEGIKVPVHVAFVPIDDGHYGFAISEYDQTQKLIVAPSLTWSTYLGTDGAFGGDTTHGIAMDSTDCIYVVGETEGVDFPITSGAFDNSYNGGKRDIFVCKFDSTGSSLVYSTYIGGSAPGSERGQCIAVDASGCAFITGWTRSEDFPTTGGAFDPSYNGRRDAFVSKLSITGDSLEYSSFLGGSGDDQGFGIAVDTFGNAYITGGTNSVDFPTTPGAFDVIIDFHDVFITKVNSEGSSLSYSTHLSGYVGNAIVVDGFGRACVTGQANSSNFPTTPGAFDVTRNSEDAFVTMMDEDGSGLFFSTYLGGNGEDEGTAIAIDSSGYIYVAGRTLSSDFPTTPGAFDETYNYQGDGFVTKLDPTGSNLIFGTYLGSTREDTCNSIAVSSSNNAYIVGDTSSTDFPTTAGAYDETHNGSYLDAFITKLDTTGASLAFSTYFGGNGSDVGSGIAVASSGEAVVGGSTTSPNLPSTTGAYNEVHNGLSDGFLAKFDATGSSLIFGTFFGASGLEYGQSVALDSLGNVFVAGTTSSSSFPTTPGSYHTTSGGGDIFLTKIIAGGGAMDFSTYFGGISADFCFGIAVDGTGSSYLTGHTISTDFPTTPGAFDEDNNGNYDIFVTKVDPTGSNLTFSTLIGGSSRETGTSVAVSDTGCVFVTGNTFSIDFPTTAEAFDDSHNSAYDVFLSKLDPTGSSLLYSTFLGGSGSEVGCGVDIDDDGNAYVFGETGSAAFPTTFGSFDETINGSGDVFVSKLDMTGGSLVYSTFLGGSQNDLAGSIEVNLMGEAYLVGATQSTDFPTTFGAFNESFGGSTDVFIACLDSTGSALTFSSYLGGSNADFGYSIALSDSGVVYVTGNTESTDFPSSSGAFDRSHNGDHDLFVSTLSKFGDSLNYSTFIGGSGGDYGRDIAVDSLGNACVVGYTGSSNFPTTNGSLDEESLGGVKALVSYLCPSPDSPVAIDGPDKLCSMSVGQTFSIEEVAGATSYIWNVPPGFVITAGQGSTMITVDVGMTAGTIRVKANADCGSSEFATKDVDVPELWVIPQSAAQGLGFLVLEGNVCNASFDEVQWTNTQNGFEYDINQNPITVNPLLTDTSIFEFRATNSLSSSTVVLTVPVLVHRFQIFDWNGDTCNTMQDLWDAAQFWRFSYLLDPNDDGFIDIRDFLYINTSGECQ